MKRSVSFRNTVEDKALDEWIMEQSKIIGFSSFMKQLAHEKMINDKPSKEKVINKKPSSDFDFDF
ncbi:MAG: hypothetical protein ACRC7N_10580 [Clostridium sp.]